jgi:hypothetical protein
MKEVLLGGMKAIVCAAALLVVAWRRRGRFVSPTGFVMDRFMASTFQVIADRV